jgi:hypothetical protein
LYSWSSSLQRHQYQFDHTCRVAAEEKHVHGLVDFLRPKLAVDVLHGHACPFHSQEGLLVDIGRLDGVYLLFDGPDVAHCLLEVVLADLLAFQCRLRRYCR